MVRAPAHLEEKAGQVVVVMVARAAKANDTDGEGKVVFPQQVEVDRFLTSHISQHSLPRFPFRP